MVPYQLIMKSGPTPGKITQLSKIEISIGRDQSNDIVISDADVSRRHARLVQQGDKYLLEDLGSTNGTFINGSRLTAAQYLQPGDLVKFGETIELVYELPGFDMQATMVANQLAGLATDPAAIPEPVLAPVPVPMPAVGVYTPEAFAAPEPQAVVPAATTYVDEADLAPQFQYEPTVPETPKKGKKTGLLIGIGCLVLLCLCGVTALVAFYIWPTYISPMLK
jgi:hypothetical protein